MFLSLLKKRRSIRRYRDVPLEDAEIAALVEAALRAPSSRDRKPWEFVVVTDGETLAALSRAKPEGGAFLEKAAAGIVVCGDWERSDVWVEDCSVASTFILLAAESLGLGGCWIQIRSRPHDDSTTAGEYVSRILGLPPRLEVESIVAVGHPAETIPPHREGELSFEKVHYGRFGKGRE